MYRLVCKMLIFALLCGIGLMAGGERSVYAGSGGAPVSTEVTVISPTATTITGDAALVVWLAAARGATVAVYEGEAVVGTGRVDVETGIAAIALQPLSRGLHKLAAAAALPGGTFGLRTALPPIIVYGGERFNISDVAMVALQLDGSEGAFCAAEEAASATVRGNIACLLQAIRPVNGAVSGPIQGRVLDDSTEKPVARATIQFRQGDNAQSGTVVATVETDSEGTYSVNLKPGVYTAEIDAAGYAKTYISKELAAGMPGNGANDLKIVRLPESGDFRIVLTWGASPRDLDAHMIGPKPGGGAFHIYYSDKTYQVGDAVYAQLDYDDTDGFGPETTTVHSVIGQVYGTYSFYVHNYSGQDGRDGNLSGSSASVQVIRGDGAAPLVYNAPTDGTNALYWHVFDIVVDGEGIRFVNRNVLSNTAPTVAGVQGLTNEILPPK